MGNEGNLTVKLPTCPIFPKNWDRLSLLPLVDHSQEYSYNNVKSLLILLWRLMKHVTLKSKDVSQITSVIAALKQRLDDNLVAAVLFGSRARGEADETSDWDLFVVVQDLPENSFQRHLHLKKCSQTPGGGG